MQWSVSTSYVTPGGNVSVTVTFCASDGPRFVTRIVYFTCSPAYTLSGVPVFSSARSASVRTVACACAVLLLASGSSVSESSTSAEFVICVPSGTSALMCTFTNTRIGTSPVGRMSPNGQNTAFDPSVTSHGNGTPPNEPSASMNAPRNSTSRGSRSRKVTSSATDGPAFSIWYS